MGFSLIIREYEHNLTTLSVKSFFINIPIKSKFINKVIYLIIIPVILLKLIDLDNLLRLNNHGIN